MMVIRYNDAALESFSSQQTLCTDFLTPENSCRRSADTISTIMPDNQYHYYRISGTITATTTIDDTTAANAPCTDTTTSTLGSNSFESTSRGTAAAII